MARSIDAKCRKCRRSGEKLFLKGDRCFSAKCGIVRKAYAPGMHGKKMSRSRSEYGAQLLIKQTIKRIYGVFEKQFRKHFKEVAHKQGIAGDLLLGRLEKRLDNVVYKIGFAASRSQARQLVNHGLIRLNKSKQTAPSTEVKIGDVVSIMQNKSKNNYFKNLEPIIKNKKDFPRWISFDIAAMEGKITGNPEKSDFDINLNAQAVVEYYSR